MTRFVLRSLIVIGISGFLASTAQAAGDPVAGRAKFDTCVGCHSIPGWTNVYPTYHVPRLGGQHADYVVAALRAYQAGERRHPSMHANSNILSEQDMRDIAAFVAEAQATERPSPVRGNVAAGQVKSETCVACHGPDGNSPITLYPRLDGQHEDYLRRSLQEYQSGARDNAIMKGIAAPLSAQDIADLSAYFASQSDGLTVVRKGSN
jgi:cytochrome c553